jgi:hypothetical protein
MERGVTGRYEAASLSGETDRTFVAAPLPAHAPLDITPVCGVRKTSRCERITTRHSFYLPPIWTETPTAGGTNMVAF